MTNPHPNSTRLSNYAKYRNLSNKVSQITFQLASASASPRTTLRFFTIDYPTATDKIQTISLTPNPKPASSLDYFSLNFARHVPNYRPNFDGLVHISSANLGWWKALTSEPSPINPYNSDALSTDHTPTLVPTAISIHPFNSTSQGSILHWLTKHEVPHEVIEPSSG